MSPTPIFTNSIGTYAQITSDVSGSSYSIEKHVVLWSTDTDAALYLTASNHEVRVAGTVASAGVAVHLGNDSGVDSGHKLHVTATGSVLSEDTAVVVRGWGSLTNEGEIQGFYQGVEIHPGTGTTSFDNSGVVKAGVYAINVSSSANGKFVLTNTGHIEAEQVAYYGGMGVDHLTNQGTMRGTIYLMNGDDVFDNRQGSVQGAIVGNWGDDRFLPGLGAETIYADSEIDTLDFRSGSGLRVSLLDADGSDNTGRAKGDSYFDIENVWGSQSGNDILIGNGANNELIGFGGADTLKGESGADRLDGGAALDKLTGGSGDDTFAFASLSQAGDRITDFGTGLDNNDRIEIDISGFGMGSVALGLLAASAFRSSANSNLAGDKNDRFVFRDSDDTLWFDRDGTGSTYSSKLVVDLQAGATLSASDILLV